MQQMNNRLLAGLAGLLLIWNTSVWSGHGGEASVERRELTRGTGIEAVLHATVTVHYTGWLADGTKFDSSLDRGQPFVFGLGAGQVIPGWEQGVIGMRVGGKRELVIPPELAYGNQGAGKTIPPLATLKFEIELLEVKLPNYTNIDNRMFQQKLDKQVKLIDIRRQDEWTQTGIVKGSIKLTAFDSQGQFIQSFPNQLAAMVARDEAFILICRTGNRSASLANWLSSQAGYSQVFNVTEGIVSWLEQGGPVEAGQ